MKTASILGVHFHAVTMEQAVSFAMSRLRARQKGYVVTPNPEIVDLCRRDSVYMGIVNHAALVLPDGGGIIYAAKILGEELYGKVAGVSTPSIWSPLWQRNRCVFTCWVQSPGLPSRRAKTCAKSIRGW